MGFAYKNNHLHFVGVGGVSMSGLARIAAHLGAKVTGSDRQDSEALRTLKQDGFDVYVGHDAEYATRCDLLVYTSAVPEADPERRAAARQIERSELLGEIASLYPTVIAVAGTHGKTTVSGMLASILQAAGVPYTAHIGGKLAGETGGTHIGGNEVFLTEACEYRRHFLHLAPTVGVVTNVEHDHPDCYPILDDVYDAFVRFGQNCRALVTEDERLICSLAHTHTSTYRRASIRPLECKNDTYLFQAYDASVKITLNVWGDFNMQNAAFAVTAARLAGIDGAHIAEGLARFEGVDRRQQYLGTLHGMPIISDYAHHPTEICALTRAAKRRYGKIAVVFEPHTYSRTLALLDRFATCFEADSVYLLPTYAAREREIEGVDKKLFEAINVQNKTYADQAETLRLLRNLPQKNYGAILFVGAGNVHEFAKKAVMLEQE